MSSTAGKFVEPIITYYINGTIRNLFCGAGLCYAIQRESYSHVPIILAFPSVYAGYHAYSRKEELLLWTRQQMKALSKV